MNKIFPLIGLSSNALLLLIALITITSNAKIDKWNSDQWIEFILQLIIPCIIAALCSFHKYLIFLLTISGGWFTYVGMQLLSSSNHNSSISSLGTLFILVGIISFFLPFTATFLNNDD